MPPKMELSGGCHCGAIRVQFCPGAGLDTLHVRTCTCSYCTAQGARYTSDPTGSMTIRVPDGRQLSRYRMGHQTADFLFCGNCGIYVAAYMEHEGQPLSVLNINCLEDPSALPSTAPVSYEQEDVDSRLSRRAGRWTPTTLAVGTQVD